MRKPVQEIVRAIMLIWNVYSKRCLSEGVKRETYAAVISE
jgi:hypothetical protein